MPNSLESGLQFKKCLNGINNFMHFASEPNLAVLGEVLTIQFIN